MPGKEASRQPKRRCPLFGVAQYGRIIIFRVNLPVHATGAGFAATGYGAVVFLWEPEWTEGRGVAVALPSLTLCDRGPFADLRQRRGHGGERSSTVRERPGSADPENQNP